MRSQQFCVFDVLMFVGLESLAANQELRAKIKELRVLESFIRSIPGININILWFFSIAEYRFLSSEY